MNKIYKVIYNAARDCYVVGSELMTSHGGARGYSTAKTGRKESRHGLKRLVIASLMAGAFALSSFGMQGAQAAVRQIYISMWHIRRTRIIPEK